MTTQEFVLQQVIGKAHESANTTRLNNKPVGCPLPQAILMHVDYDGGNAGFVIFRNANTWTTILHLKFFFIGNVAVHLFKRLDQLNAGESRTSSLKSWEFKAMSDDAGKFLVDMHNTIYACLIDRALAEL